MDDGRPPHPGPRPEALEFPFDDASRAAASARRLAAELSSLRRHVDTCHDELATSAAAGRFAVWMRAQGQHLHDELLHVVRELDDQADEVDGAARSARRRIDDRLDRVDWWELRHRRWLEWAPAHREHA